MSRHPSTKAAEQYKSSSSADPDEKKADSRLTLVEKKNGGSTKKTSLQNRVPRFFAYLIQNQREEANIRSLSTNPYEEQKSKGKDQLNEWISWKKSGRFLA